MQPRASDVYDVERWGYDIATKVWTFVLGLVVAGVVDWCTVAMPVRDHPPHDPNMKGWIVALIIAMLPPASWLIGRLRRRDWNSTVMWTVAVAAAVVFQLVALTWARTYL